MDNNTPTKDEILRECKELAFFIELGSPGFFDGEERPPYEPNSKEFWDYYHQLLKKYGYEKEEGEEDKSK